MTQTSCLRMFHVESSRIPQMVLAGQTNSNTRMTERSLKNVVEVLLEDRRPVGVSFLQTLLSWDAKCLLYENTHELCWIFILGDYLKRNTRTNVGTAQVELGYWGSLSFKPDHQPVFCIFTPVWWFLRICKQRQFVNS